MTYEGDCVVRFVDALLTDKRKTKGLREKQFPVHRLESQQRGYNVTNIDPERNFGMNHKKYFGGVFFLVKTIIGNVSRFRILAGFG